MTTLPADLLLAAAQGSRLRPADAALLRTTRPAPAQARAGIWVAAIEAADWTRLRSLAADEVRARQRALKRLRRVLALAGGRARQLEAIADVVRSIPAPAARDDDAVKAHLRSAGLSDKHIARGFEIRNGLRGEAIVRTARSGALDLGRTVDEVAVVQLRAVAASLHASAVARLNLAAVPAAADPSALLTATRRDLAGAWTRTAEALRDATNARVALAANELGRIAAASIPTLVDATLAATPAGGSISAAQARTALQAGDLLRAALTAQLAAIRIRWLLSAPDDLPERQAWWSPPDARPFAAQQRSDTSIRDLVDGSVSDGSAVRVQGMVRDVTVTHRRRKVISTATLADRQGRQVTVALPYIKIDSGGIVPGSPVLLGGTWHHDSAEVGGPALQLDLVSRRERAAASLHDWAAWLLRSMYQPVPHGLDAAWGWVLGIDGPANPIRYGIWYDRKAS